MKQKILIALVCFSFIGCTKVSSVGDIDVKTKNFLSGDGNIAFMGWPYGGGAPSCEASESGQGYRFNFHGEKGTIQSVRPSGVEFHDIVNIGVSGSNINVNARNKANLPFTLNITNINEDGADISFNGEAKSHFMRCVQ